MPNINQSAVHFGAGNPEAGVSCGGVIWSIMLIAKGPAVSANMPPDPDKILAGKLLQPQPCLI